MKFQCFDESFFKKEAIFMVSNSIERKLSEFFQLWELLERIYPTQVIPPLPKTVKEPKTLENLINFALEAVEEHPILSEDEYFKTFLEAKNYAELVPMIKNVDGPIQIKAEYFKRLWRIGGTEMTKDIQYQEVN